MRTVNRFIFLLLVILGPFHAFFITWLKSAGIDPIFVLGASAWREIIVCIMGLLALIQIIRNKQNIFARFDKLDWTILAYAALSFVFLFFQWNEKTQWMMGVRFSVLPIVFYLIVRFSSLKALKKILIAALAVCALVVIFGLIHSFFLPQDFLLKFGYSIYSGQYQAGDAIAACQYLEHSQTLCRAVATFGGPTRYGVYLMLMIGLALPFLGLKNGFEVSARTKWAVRILLLGAILSAILTYSRSVWIGMLTMGIFAFIWFVRHHAEQAEKKRPQTPWLQKTGIKIIIGSAAVMILVIAGWQIYALSQQQVTNWPPPFVRVLFVRDSSTSEHWNLLKEGAHLLAENPFGMGLGTVGPASYRFQKLLTENWFLQIGLEMGILGALLFISILVLLAKKLLAKKNAFAFGIFLALLGISVTGLFTHSFEETTAVLLLFGLAGGVGRENFSPNKKRISI